MLISSDKATLIDHKANRLVFWLVGSPNDNVHDVYIFMKLDLVQTLTSPGADIFV